MLVFKATGKYIHPTRYRQIIETQSAEFLLPNEQKWISVVESCWRVRTVVVVVESKNLDEQCEKIQHSSAARDDVRQDTSIVCTPQITPRRKGIRFTPEEDICIRLGIEQFGLCWFKILRRSEFNF